MARRSGSQLTTSYLCDPVDWGITRDQVADPKWKSENTMYTLVSDFIIPWTAGHGVGYALHINRKAPKRVNAMVSHSFAENAEELMEDVLRATDKGDVMYICAFSNYQAEDGAGPSLDEQLGERLERSPFFQVIAYLAQCQKQHGCKWWCSQSCAILLPAMVTFASLAFLLVSFPEVHYWASEKTALTLALCSLLAGFLLHACLKLCCSISYRMIVVPTRNQDIYQRLWCVFEIFAAAQQGLYVTVAPTLALAGHVEIENAGCSKLSDRQKIQDEIDAVPQGHAMVSKAIHKITQRARLPVLIHLVQCACLLTIPCMVRSIDTFGQFSWIFAVAGLCWNFVWVLVCYGMAKRCQGVFRCSPTLLVALAGICLAQEALYVLYFFLERTSERTSDELHCIVEAVFQVLEMASADVHAAALIYTTACCSQGKPCFIASRPVIVLVSCIFIVYSSLSSYFIYGDIPLLFQESIALYLTWSAADHWGLSIKRCSSKPQMVTAMAWTVLAIVLCWFFWICDWVMAYVDIE